MASEPTRYRFGPLERRGLVAGWRGGQIASVAGGLVVAILALQARTSAATVAAAVLAVVGGVALATWPVGGLTAEEWLPTVTRWGTTAAAGERRRRAAAPARGHRRSPGTVGALPSPGAFHARRGVFGGLEILGAAAEPGSPPVGVVHDPRARTFTATLAVRGHSFALLGPDDQERRVGSWATVLASMARERSVVHRVQWIASSLPDDGEAVGRFLSERSVLSDDEAARRSYAGLLADAGASTSRHEVLLCVQVLGRRARARHGAGAGAGAAGACAVLLREVAMLRRLLADADVVVERALGPSTLAASIRRIGEPRRVAEGRVTNAGPASGAAWPWPMATDVEWDAVRTDGNWHSTYWIAEWPRVEVGPDFLGPLLFGPVRRSVAVVMEPLSPSRAVRQVEQARTADLADSELRRRGGFLTTARRSREAQLVSRREEELADGHASFRFSGYVTVTAATREQLAEACEATEQAAGQCRLELRRIYGDQDRALACTLPLGRGLQ
jgi:hypothetical protein